MNSRMKIEEPGKIVCTITTTATAAEWEAFREALDFVANKSVNVPDSVYHFKNQISELLAQARRIYWPSESEEVGHD